MSDERHINGTLFFSTKVAANRLGITPAQVRKQCQDGTLNAQKVGNAWFVELPQKKSVGSRVASTLVSALPTKPIAQLPVAYAKSLPMVIGVVVSIALFFFGTLPFMSESIASFAALDRPVNEMKETIGAGYEHFVRKTDELIEYSSLSMALGVTALNDSLVEKIPEFERRQKPHTASSRMSSLARTIAHSKRVPVSVPVVEQAQTLAAAASSLYQFERLTAATAPFASGATWGCVLGVSACAPEEPQTEPLPGVSVYDASSKIIYCVQIVDGQTVSTPGRCLVEAQ